MTCRNTIDITLEPAPVRDLPITLLTLPLGPAGNTIDITRVQLEGSHHDNGLQLINLLLKRGVVENFRSDFSQGRVVG